MLLFQWSILYFKQQLIDKVIKAKICVIKKYTAHIIRFIQGVKRKKLPFTLYYHTTRKNKTIFGKDQKMPATGYILYPTLSASLTHYIQQWVRIFMSMHPYHRAFSSSRANTLMYFPRIRGGFEQVVLLVFVLTFSTLCRIKIISFCSLKNGKLI